MTEVWKKTKVAKIEVSNLGNTRLTAHLIMKTNKYGTIYKVRYRERVLKQQINPKGYVYATISVRNKTVNLNVHRLVALAFIPNPENKPEVNHKDGNKSNNHYSNLEWVTHKENIQHAIKNKLLIHCKGSKTSNAVLDEGQVKVVKTLLKNKEISIPNISRYFNIAASAIFKIRKGENWSHVECPTGY